MVRQHGGVIGVNIINPQAPVGLGGTAHGHQVVGILHLVRV